MRKISALIHFEAYNHRFINTTQTTHFINCQTENTV